MVELLWYIYRSRKRRFVSSRLPFHFTAQKCRICPFTFQIYVVIMCAEAFLGTHEPVPANSCTRKHKIIDYYERKISNKTLLRDYRTNSELITMLLVSCGIYKCRCRKFAEKHNAVHQYRPNRRVGNETRGEASGSRFVAIRSLAQVWLRHRCLCHCVWYEN